LRLENTKRGMGI